MAFHVSQVSFIITNCILGVGFFVGIPSNVVVISTILWAPSLRTRLTNLLICNLCVADLVTVLVDIPFMWRITYANYYKDATVGFSELACDVQVFCHALGISAQASALITIAYERYHSIANPFEKNQIRQRSLLFAAICWLVAIALAVFQLTLAKQTITHDICSMSVEICYSVAKYVVVVFGSGAFLIIVVYYVAIIYLVKKHLHKFDQKVGTLPPTASGSTNTMLLKAATANTSPDEVPRTPSPRLLEEPVEHHHQPHRDDVGAEGSAVEVDQDDPGPPPIFGAVCVRNETNREKGKRKFEAEIAKRLFYIIASFLAVWMPYASLMVAITESSSFLIKSKEVTFELLFICHTLTTIASALNPLIYALPNCQFRSILASTLRRTLRSLRDKSGCCVSCC